MRAFRIWPGVLLAVVLALFAAPAPAPARAGDDGLRCGNRLVTLGDLQATVLDRCGEPAFRSSRVESRVRFGRTVWVTVDEWVYRFGPRDFPRRALFEGGRLISVDALSR